MFVFLFIPGAFPLFSTPIRANRANSESTFVDVTGEADPWHARSQLYDQNNGSFSRNPFSVIASGGDTASDNEEPTAASITVEDLVEPCLDHHHFSDAKQSFAQTVQFSKVRM